MKKKRSFIAFTFGHLRLIVYVFGIAISLWQTYVSLDKYFQYIRSTQVQSWSRNFSKVSEQKKVEQNPRFKDPWIEVKFQFDKANEHEHNPNKKYKSTWFSQNFSHLNFSFLQEH